MLNSGSAGDVIPDAATTFLEVMNSEPRQTLRSLIAKHGLDLCSDAKRCQGLLRDLCGAHPREVNILTGALRERVPLDLLAGRNAMPHGLLMARLTKRLEDQLALTEEAARWGVESWALALGIITEADLEEAHKKSAGASQSPAPRAREENQPQQPPPPSNTRRQPTQYPGQQTGRPRASATAPKTSSPFPTPAPSGTTPGVGSNAGYRQAPAGQAPAVRHSSGPGVPQQPEPPINYDLQRRGGFKFRGCVMGCLLLIILSSLLFLVVPYVVSVLREEQQQRINEPQRIPSQ
jgi:hypothetical protein